MRFLARDSRESTDMKIPRNETGSGWRQNNGASVGVKPLNGDSSHEYFHDVHYHATHSSK